MMETMEQADEPAPATKVAAQAGRERMVMERMSLEELLYYVLVGDGRRITSDKE
jgi:hypothetical protein